MMRIISMFTLQFLLVSGTSAPALKVHQIEAAAKDEYLSWSPQQARDIGKNMRASGKVGGGQGLLHTDRAINYKLRATWFTPEVIRASARMLQINGRLSDEQTRALVSEAAAAGPTVVLVELDPNEGSGVIPSDWQAFLQPKGLKPGQAGAVPGINTAKLRDVKALAGVMPRDYNYDQFWVVFPLADDRGRPVFSDSDSEAEIVVRINNKEGKASWTIPDSIRKLARQ